jgi:acyl-coenzyme A thioesterase PaaI-like protein
VSKLEDVSEKMMEVFRQRYGENEEGYRVPPPVFTELGGEFIDFDQDKKELTARYPIEERFLNPYGVLQGGMIAAAIDNTLGPLSMLVAPPNLTRKLEIKYSRPVRPSDKWLIVRAWLTEQEGRRLFFKAEARALDGGLIGRAAAMHWIIEEEG